MRPTFKAGIGNLLRATTEKGRRNRTKSEPAHVRGLPTFLIIGAAKGGTTSMYHYLNSHPEVYMSPVKEPHFFTFQGSVPEPETLDNPDAIHMLPPETRQLRTLADYSALFKEANSNHHAIGEASTGYLCEANTPAKVRACLPDVKLIAILRDPAERAWSDFLMMKRFGQESEDTLLEVVRQRESTRYLGLGCYGEALDRWYTEFPREQVRVFLYDDFAADTVAIVTDVLQFISVDPSVPLDLSERHNSHTSHEPQLDAETRATLVEYFQDDIRRLEDILKRDLTHWRV